MKTLCLFCVLFTFAAFQPSTPAQGLGGTDTTMGGGNSIDSLHAAITKGPYVYQKGTFNLSIKFKSNGSGECTDWTFKWHSKDPLTIELTMLDPKQRLTDKKTTLTFSADYKTFTGTDFDGITKVSGHTAQ